MAGTINRTPFRAQRCAIYTRRSVLEGPEREFNSLETQRTICSAYITSQRHKGWLELAKHYDDGGKSGATLDRPAMSELLADVEQGLIDVVVVYKLDRITRTLLDFVRLVDFFEGYGTVFVSITQNFDTADSMGRLILNVLLTFAQFEREICSDRIRDRIALKKQAGRWTGGPPPLGYELVSAKLRINPTECKIIEFMFRRFLELESYEALYLECKAKGIRGKIRKTRAGRVVGGGPINSGALYHILGNPIYVGDIRHYTDCYPGIHEPIIDREMWDRVQLLRADRTKTPLFPPSAPNLLTGLLFDSYGRPMCMVDKRWANSRKARYYISNHSAWAMRQKLKRMRTNGDELEELIVAAVRSTLADREKTRAILMQLGHYGPELDMLAARSQAAGERLARATPKHQKRILKALIVRIELSRERIKIVFRCLEVERFLAWDGMGNFKAAEDLWRRIEPSYLLDVPASVVRFQRKFELPILPCPIDDHPAPKKGLVSLIKEARKAQALVDAERSMGIKEYAARMRRCPSTFARVLRLNYLAPDIQTSIFDGTQPPDLTRRDLVRADLPMDWALQRKLFGFAEQPDHQRGDQRY